MAISYGMQGYQGGLDEEEERRRAMELLIQEKLAEDSRNIQVQQAAPEPPPRETRPKLNPQQMAGLQNLLLQVREGKIAEPTQSQKAEIQGLLLGTPEENAAREAEYAETERIKQLVARAGANKDTGASFNINPITGQADFAAVTPEGFERVYSERQKQQISQLNNVIQDVRNNPKFDERDKAVAIRKATVQLNSIKPAMRVKEPPPPMGDSWEGTYEHPITGDIMGYDRNHQSRVVTHYKDSKKYLERKMQHEEALRQDAREAASFNAYARRVEDEERRKDMHIQKLTSEQIKVVEEKEVPDPRNPGKTTTIKESVERYRTPAEVAERMAVYMAAGGRAGSVGEREVTRVATPEQLQWGPSGVPPAGMPQPPPMTHTAPPQVGPGIATPRTQAEYDALPVGAPYIGKDGQPHRKMEERKR